MKLRFLGTRGKIETSTSNHKRHSSLEAAYYDHHLIMDCGEDWLDQVADWDSDAILIKHAHPEHAFEVTAFTVLHSTRAPAVGYRLIAGKVSIFYVPDVAWIKDREQAMREITVYIDDVATIKHLMVRKPGNTIIGHVPIQTQLTWC